MTSLNNLQPGETAVIEALNMTGSMHRRLLDIGLIKNTCVECVGKSPLGDPCAYLIRGAVIALRSEDSKNILIHPTERKATFHEMPQSQHL